MEPPKTLTEVSILLAILGVAIRTIAVMAKDLAYRRRNGNRPPATLADLKETNVDILRAIQAHNKLTTAMSQALASSMEVHNEQAKGAIVRQERCTEGMIETLTELRVAIADLPKRKE